MKRLHIVTPSPSEAAADRITLCLGPVQPITRPRLDRDHVGLGCGHRAPKPLVKVWPKGIACSDCARGAPTDRDLVLHAIQEASAEDLRAYADALGRRGAA